MTNVPNNENSLDNAQDIIERFGGIRPMASKIGAAVTTVQGWKKRNNIPPNRIDSIITAAQEHSIDLSDLVNIPAPLAATAEPRSADNVQEAASPNTTPDIPTEKTAPPAAHQADPKPTTYSTMSTEQQVNLIKKLVAAEIKSKAHEKQSILESNLHDDIIYSITQAERRAVKKSRWTSIALIGVSTLALALIFGLQSGGGNEQQRQAELQAMQFEMQQMKEELKEAKAAADKNDTLLNSKSVQAAQKQAKSLINEAKVISNKLINDNSNAVLSKISELESYLDSLGDFPRIANITQRFAAFTATTGGQDLLDQSTQDLSSVLSRFKNPTDDDIETAIEQARSVSPALTQSLENVPAEDLKAAAMLLTMTQLRSSLNRDGQAFDQDLALLQSLTKNSSPALQDSINRLSPHARSGILTSSGLSNELRSLTGEIVIASLKGEELSIQDRAKARMESVLLLNNSDRLGSNNTAQQTLSQAESKVQSGDLEGAISDMKTLKGRAGKLAQPWIEQAEISIMARDLKTTLSGVLDTKAAGLKSYGASQHGTSNGLRPIFLRP